MTRKHRILSGVAGFGRIEPLGPKEQRPVSAGRQRPAANPEYAETGGLQDRPDACVRVAPVGRLKLMMKQVRRERLQVPTASSKRSVSQTIATTSATTNRTEKNDRGADAPEPVRRSPTGARIRWTEEPALPITRSAAPLS